MTSALFTRISGIAAVSSFVCTAVAIVAYVALGSPPIAQSIGWLLFGVHLLATMLGALAALIGLLGGRWSCAVSLVICAYVLLFQFTLLVPPPVRLIWGPP